MPSCPSFQGHFPCRTLLTWSALLGGLNINHAESFPLVSPLNGLPFKMSPKYNSSDPKNSVPVHLNNEYAVSSSVSSKELSFQNRLPSRPLPNGRPICPRRSEQLISRRTTDLKSFLSWETWIMKSANSGGVCPGRPDQQFIKVYHCHYHVACQLKRSPEYNSTYWKSLVSWKIWTTDVQSLPHCHHEMDISRPSSKQTLQTQRSWFNSTLLVSVRTNYYILV